MGFLKQGFSGALAAVMVLTSGGLCVGQSVTIHAETKAKTYEDYKKVLNYTAEYQGYEAYKEGLENVKRPDTSKKFTIQTMWQNVWRSVRSWVLLQDVPYRD